MDTTQQHVLPLGAVEIVGNDLMLAGGGFWEDVGDWFSAAADNVVEFGNAFMDEGQAFFEDVFQSAYDLFDSPDSGEPSLWDEVTDFVSDFGNSITDYYSNVDPIDVLCDPIGTLGDALGTALGDAWYDTAPEPGE